MHVDESILGSDGKIDPRKVGYVARLGGDWYCRVDEQNLFRVEKPNTKLGVGVDALPQGIRHSVVLTGNHLGMLANVHEIPVIDPSFTSERLKNIFQYYSVNPQEMEQELHRYASELLNEERLAEAWQVLLAGDTSV
eukprot:TRINITY_DN86208_c0_g1_i1.p1 TRINITY_DN86208_c0_g1~~TRINITY_DN86208_c0_g1_i1.p1  ORF type:complete len:137 (-),score=22.58 TRINITY_DN86208_c0_g1_i1:51-461(-)